MQTFTKDNLHSFLHKKWRDLGHDIPEGDRMGVEVLQVVEHSTQRNNDLADEHFDLWIAIFDEFVSWLISVASVAYDKSPKKPTDYERCVTALMMRIVADSFAIRHLMTLGFDAAARITVRSTAEHMEVLLAIIDDEELAERFEKTRNPYEANQFWKQHVGGNKLRPRIRAVWDKFFNKDHADAARRFSNWGSSDYDELSAICHPSMMGCGHALVPAKKEYSDDSWFGMWGDRSLASISTIQTYISYMFPMILAIGDFPFGPRGFAEERRFCETNELHQHIRLGRSALGSLVVSLNMEENSEYVYPTVAEILPYEEEALPHVEQY